MPGANTMPDCEVQVRCADGFVMAVATQRRWRASMNADKDVIRHSEAFGSDVAKATGTPDAIEVSAPDKAASGNGREPACR